MKMPYARPRQLVGAQGWEGKGGKREKSVLGESHRRGQSERVGWALTDLDEHDHAFRETRRHLDPPL